MPLMPSQLEHITHREVRDMEEPARRILREMEAEHRRITQGHYRLIVGDDASGRLFGMLFHKVISRVHKLCDIPPPALAFCVGHPKRSPSFYVKMTRVVQDRLETLMNTNNLVGRKLSRPLESGLPDPQILIATDGIQSGTSLIPAFQSCEANGIGIEAAAIKVWYDYLQQRRNLGGSRPYDGQGDRSIYKCYSLIGTWKELGVDTMAHPYRDGCADTVASARRDVGVIANRLTTWFTKEFGLKESTT
jgi:hypothetical protein